MTDDSELVGVVPKNSRAEVRVYRKLYKGRRVVDVRVWWIPQGQAEFVPSSKGISLDASKVALLRDLLGTLP